MLSVGDKGSDIIATLYPGFSIKDIKLQIRPDTPKMTWARPTHNSTRVPVYNGLISVDVILGVSGLICSFISETQSASGCMSERSDPF